MKTKDGALAGLSVVEIGSLVAAPFCGKLLADLGADVVKIEPPGSGDPARRRGPFPNDEPHPERSALFLYLNTSKRSVTLDPATDEGNRILRELLAGADVLIEDTAPGTLERLGLGYADLSRTNPELVMTSITPFGQTGPHRDFRGHPLNCYHVGGHTAFHLPEGAELRPPAKAAGYLGEYDAGLVAAVGTLGALAGRRLSGRGRYVDLSKQEAMMAALPVQTSRSLSQDPHVRERGVLTRVAHPVVGERIVVGPPWKLAGAAVRGPAPLIGEHNEAVLSEVLGMSRKEIEQLAEAGALD